MRYRLIKSEWMKQDHNLQSQPNVIEGDDFDAQFLQDKNNLGFNVYYFPNRNSVPLDKPFLSGKDVDVFTSVFVDMDLKDGIYKTPEEFIDFLMNEVVKPNKIVLSGNGVHAYWNVSDLTLESYVELQLQLIKKFKTDRSIWTVLQLMRLPGLYNTKDPNNLKFVEELVISEDKYTVNDLKSVLPELTSEDRTKMENHINKVKGLAEFADFDESSIEIPAKFITLLEKNRLVQDLWAAEHGQRSEADYKIAKMLFDLDYTRDEALAVIMNSSKSLSKGAHAKSYSLTIVGTAYMNKSKHSVPSVAELLKIRAAKPNKLRRLIKGPSYFDCLFHKWRTGQVLGLVGAPEGGKSTVSIDMIYNMIKNDPENDDVFLFFSLEMSDMEIIEKWERIIENDTHLSNRLFVISNEDSEGVPRHINLQDIYAFIKDISKVSGKKVKAAVLDHIGLISKKIDTKRKPDFGISGREDFGYGSEKAITEKEMSSFVKTIAKELDVMIIAQSQTTKLMAGAGDTPLGLGAAYGSASFSWDCDAMITIWQPLKRVQNKSALCVTAWQYTKNRNKHKSDKVRTFQACVLGVDIDTGKLKDLTDGEFGEFLALNEEATQLRKMDEKNSGVMYSHSNSDSKDEIQTS